MEQELDKLNARTSALEQANKTFTITHNTTKELRGHRNKVISIAWSNKGKLASGSSDHTAKVWNISNTSRTTREVEFQGHTGVVNQVQFDPTNGNTLATASVDKSVRLWDVRVSGANKCLHKIPTVGENINLAWRPDGVHLVVGNKEDTISIIDVRTHKILKSVKYKHLVNELKWDKTGQLLVMTTGNGNIEVFDYDVERITANSSQTWQRVRPIPAHTRDVFCIDFDPLGRYFAVGSEDSIVSLWSLPEFIPVRSISSFEEPIKNVSFSFDGQYLAYASKEMIDIALVESCESVHKIKSNENENSQVYSLAWSATDLLLAYTKEDRIQIFGYPSDK
ncbi:THO complex subunit 3 [Acrasis kona]|uniref:THO complex subunit 3 n=1 Tax=Acrasis kona TaxID=1008807 RepID=A0AAW2ZFV9_9EUKA